MKLGVFSPALADKSLDDALSYLESQGVQMIELGTGGFPGTAHCDASVLVRDEKKFEEFKATMARHSIEISAFSCHGNPIHPDKVVAKKFDDCIHDTILLAEKMGIHQINTFSGCPGDCEDSKYPNWVTCPWPDDFGKILDWQWNEVLIPYWKKTVAFAKEHGVNKIGLELHPGFCVYNTQSMLRLREAVGPEMGANLDFSHLVWQGMDPVSVIRELGPAIFHFHAKDTRIDAINTAKTGVLDTKPYSDEIHRSWIFRSVGYGMDAQQWKDIISNLRMVGYDYAISIEHEDSLMNQYEGLEKAIAFLKDVLIFQSKGDMWWA